MLIHVVKITPVVVFIDCHILNISISQNTLNKLIAGLFDDPKIVVHIIVVSPVIFVTLDQINFVVSKCSQVVSVVHK